MSLPNPVQDAEDKKGTVLVPDSFVEQPAIKAASAPPVIMASQNKDVIASSTGLEDVFEKISISRALDTPQVFFNPQFAQVPHIPRPQRRYQTRAATCADARAAAAAAEDEETRAIQAAWNFNSTDSVGTNLDDEGNPNLDDLKVVKVFAQRQRQTIRLVRHNRTNKLVVMKKMKMGKPRNIVRDKPASTHAQDEGQGKEELGVSVDTQYRVPTEMEMLSQYVPKGHPNIVALIKCFREGPMEDVPTMTVELEYCSGGDLHKWGHFWHKTHQDPIVHPTPPLMVVHVMASMFDALSFLHLGLGPMKQDGSCSHVYKHIPILHSDIKGDNIFLRWPAVPRSDGLPEIVLGDFDMAAREDSAYGTCGTRGFTAPEVVAYADAIRKANARVGPRPDGNLLVLSKASDVYSLAVTILRFVAAHRNWNEDGIFEHAFHVIDQNPQWTQAEASGLKHISAILRDCSSDDPSRRRYTQSLAESAAAIRAWMEESATPFAPGELREPSIYEIRGRPEDPDPATKPATASTAPIEAANVKANDVYIHVNNEPPTFDYFAKDGQGRKLTDPEASCYGKFDEDSKKYHRLAEQRQDTSPPKALSPRSRLRALREPGEVSRPPVEFSARTQAFLNDPNPHGRFPRGPPMLRWGDLTGPAPDDFGLLAEEKELEQPKDLEKSRKSEETRKRPSPSGSDDGPNKQPRR